MGFSHSIFEKDRYGSCRIDEACCRENVWSDYSSHQCTRKAKVFEDVTLPDGTVKRMGFCKQHSMEYVEAKRKAQRDEWDAQRKASVRASNVRDSERVLVRVVMKALAHMDGLPPKVHEAATALKKARES